MESEMRHMVQDILHVLEEERRILLCGDLRNLEKICDRKRALEKKCMEISDAKLPELRELREKAARNHDLLRAALEGIRSAADRVATLRRVRDCLETYDHVGRKRLLKPKQSYDMEKRA